jgi:integrase
MPLTVVEIKNAKSRKSAYKVSDGGGLHLLIQPSGSKLWRLAYRFRGRQKLVSFGPYPAVSLIEAREKREDAKRALRDGNDPAEIRAEREREAVSDEDNTFRAAAQEYMDFHRPEVSEKTAYTYDWYLNKVLRPEFVRRPIRKIKPREIADELLRINAVGMRDTAHKVRWFIGTVFRRANLTGRAEGDPSATLKGLLPERREENYAAITDPARFGSLLAAIDEYDGWPTIRGALQMLALTFVRPGEIRSARWRDFDFKEKVWRIPAELMKKDRPHDVPLSRQALSVLAGLRPVSGHSELVFPAIRSTHKKLSDNTLNAALRRIGYDTQTEHTAHGFRSSASTLLHEAKFPDKAVEFQLAHLEPSKVKRAYNRAEYWDERVPMMQAWADMCDKFKDLSVI